MRLIDADELLKEINQFDYYDQVKDAPTVEAVPLSVIEKINDAIDNAEPDTYIENPLFYGFALTKEHIHEIINEAVKECEHD